MRFGLPKRAFVISGAAFIFIGVVMLLNSFSGVTGAVIFEEGDLQIGFYIGLWFLVAGALALVMARESTRESSLEKRVRKAKSRMRADLRSGRIGDYRELRQYAKKIGADLVEDGPHTKIVYKGRTLPHTIPRDNTSKTGMYRAILKDIYDAA